MTPSQLAAAVRRKHPGAYDSIPDDKLAAAWVKKYPVYGEQLDKPQAAVVGGGTAAPSVSPTLASGLTPPTTRAPQPGPGAAPAPAPQTKTRQQQILEEVWNDPSNPTHAFTGGGPNAPRL